MRSSKSRSRNKNRNNRPQGGNIVNRVFDSSGPEGKVRGTPQQIIDKYNQLARDAQLSGDRVAVENFQQHSEHYTRMLAAAQKEIDARQQQHNQQHNNQQQGGQNNQGDQNSGNNNGQSGHTNGGDGDRGGRGGDQQNSGNRAEKQSNGAQPSGERGDTAQGGGHSEGGQGNRRRNRSRDRDDRQPDQPIRSDVIEADESDSGLVETPEAKAEVPAPMEPAAKPRRTRTRKKAPAKTDEASAAPDAQPSEDA
ncbi:MAG: DUF4167 domain-containing protein [Jannaschia sp.]